MSATWSSLHRSCWAASSRGRETPKPLRSLRAAPLAFRPYNQTSLRPPVSSPFSSRLFPLTRWWRLPRSRPPLPRAPRGTGPACSAPATRRRRPSRSPGMPGRGWQRVGEGEDPGQCAVSISGGAQGEAERASPHHKPPEPFSAAARGCSRQLLLPPSHLLLQPDPLAVSSSSSVHCPLASGSSTLLALPHLPQTASAPVPSSARPLPLCRAPACTWMPLRFGTSVSTSSQAMTS